MEPDKKLKQHMDQLFLHGMTGTSTQMSQQSAAPTAEEVLRLTRELGRPPDPFNHATRVVLANDVAKLITPHLKGPRYIWMGFSIEVCPHMPDGYGLGFRRKKDGDDQRLMFGDEVICWSCRPSNTAAIGGAA